MATPKLCTVDGCGKRLFAKGWCTTHYSRWRIYGDHLHDPPRLQLRLAPCSVPGCEAPYLQKGFCRPHYLRWRRHGDPLAGNASAKFSLDEEGRKAYRRQHYQENKAAYLARAVAQPAEDRRKYRAKWKVQNPAIVIQQNRLRKASIHRATPGWLTDAHWAEIDAIYAEARRITAETGIPHNVDHTIPLAGKLVSGLHVPWNLQVLTEDDNFRKHNRFEPG